jgi:hypothetical protein
MSFPRHREIYPPMEAQTNTVGASAHRLDEFPAGYSLDGLLSSRARRRFTSRAPVCGKVVLPVEGFSANGQQCLNCLCQPRGQAQFGVERKMFRVKLHTCGAG